MKWQTFDEILQDAKGHIIGRAKTYRRPLSRSEREVCQQFLQGLVRCRDDDKGVVMATKDNGSDKCNIVYLAGKISSLRVDDDSGFFLMDAGPDKKYVPCTVFKDDKLASILGRFQNGDALKITGYVRPWSTKVNERWENHLEVRITAIKTEPPARRQMQPAIGTDDDIPF